LNKHHRVQLDTVLNWGLESPQNSQAGKPALRVARTFLSAGLGDFPVARRSWPDFPTEKNSGDGRKEAGQGMLIEKRPSPEQKPITGCLPACVKTDSGDSRQGGGDEESR